MPLSAQCSHCQATMKLADTLAGKRVKCPKCSQVFAVPGNKQSIAKGPPPTAAGKRSPDDEKPRSKKRRDEDSEDDPRPSRSKKSRQKSNSNHLLLAVASGGGVLLVGIIILFIVMSMKGGPAVAEAPAVAKPKPAPVTPVANNNATPPAADPAPQTDAAPAPQAAPLDPTPPPTQSAPPAAAPAASAQAPTVAAKGLQPGAKITVRPQINSAPPGFTGDYNAAVKQAVEDALKVAGYQPAPEGSGDYVLQITAQINPTGKQIQVRMAAPQVARPKGKGIQALPQQQVHNVQEEEMLANLVVTDTSGATVWKTNSKFQSHNRNFRVNPSLEMQNEMWLAFATWVKGPGIQNMR